MKNEQTVDQIRVEIASLHARIAALSGEPIMLWHGTHGEMADIPAEPGYILKTRWAVEDQSSDEWYPTLEGAKAALWTIAQQNGCIPSKSGLLVDLTSPGCHSSRAWIDGTKLPEGFESPSTSAVRVALHAALAKRKLLKEMDEASVFSMAREIAAALDAQK